MTMTMTIITATEVDPIPSLFFKSNLPYDFYSPGIHLHLDSFSDGSEAL